MHPLILRRVLKGVSRLPVDGRYIYLYRKSDNNIYIRNYDRGTADKKWMYPGNCREHTNFGQYACMTSGNKAGRYLHVRHSQLTVAGIPFGVVASCASKAERSAWRTTSPATSSRRNNALST